MHTHLRPWVPHLVVAEFALTERRLRFCVHVFDMLNSAQTAASENPVLRVA